MNKIIEVSKQDLVDFTVGLDGIVENCNDVMQIMTRCDEKNLLKFHTIDEKKLATISKNMQEIHRATRSFGRRNTQTTNKLMTLTMLNDTSPYRILRQCISQIEKTRGAIKENFFKLLKKKLKLEELLKKIGVCESDKGPTKEDDYKLRRYKLKAMKSISDISDSMLYLEGAFKEIASFQHAYNQIRKNNNIPEDWDEQNFEDAEVKFHVRQAFNMAYKDLLNTDRPNMGTMEYMSQFGLNPQSAYETVRNYIKACAKLFPTGKGPSYNDLQRFLDEQMELNKENYKDVMKKIGLDELIDKDFLYKE